LGAGCSNDGDDLLFRHVLSLIWLWVGARVVATVSQRSCSPAHLVGDSLRSGKEGVLERRTVGDRGVGGGDSPGVVDVAEGLLGDHREDLPRPPPRQRTLLD